MEAEEGIAWLEERIEEWKDAKDIKALERIQRKTDITTETTSR